MNRAFFLDRDGVVIKMIYDPESGYIHTALCPSQVQLMPGVVELLKTAKAMGYKNIIVSNQPDIGLNRISKKNFEAVKEKVHDDLQRQRVTINGEYYCFHHPFAEIEEYRKRCSCRKPQPGLLLTAAKDLDLDLTSSWVIGDGVNDVIAGHRAGCKTILLANVFESEYLRLVEENLNGIKPDILAKNLKAVPLLLKRYSHH